MQDQTIQSEAGTAFRLDVLQGKLTNIEEMKCSPEMPQPDRIPGIVNTSQTQAHPQRVHVRNASIQAIIEIKQEQPPPQIIPQFINN